MPPSFQQTDYTNAGRHFETTHWSVVAKAAEQQTPEAEQAMEALCKDYWFPLYGYLRRKGSTPQEAEDLTQSFFAGRVVTKKIFKGVSADKGKFRNWLLASLKNYVNNEWDKRTAEKRGGKAGHVSLDLEGAEDFYSMEHGLTCDPENTFDHTWAITVLKNSMEKLRLRYQQGGRGELFEQLRFLLPGGKSKSSYKEISDRIGKSEDATKMAASRFRQEFGVVLREEIRRTVSTPDELQEELQYLMSLLSR